MCGRVPEGEVVELILEISVGSWKQIEGTACTVAREFEWVIRIRIARVTKVAGFVYSYPLGTVFLTVYPML